MSTPAPIILNGFSMNSVSHVNYGLWRHPRDQTHRYTTIEYWTELATILDRGNFDTFFLADALGLLDTYDGSAAASLRTGTQSPVDDPLLLISAMAAATRDLGFGVTVSTTYEHPYLLARKFSTLDHLTGGRVAWNVVTSQLDSAARNLGLDKQIPHDERYDRADEFLDVVFKLWEASWEDDAVVRDAVSGVYTDPNRVHAIGHRGRYFSVPDAHLSEPGPQRTPLLLQAGGSPRGQRFAAGHAEVVFVAGADADGIRRNVAAIRESAAEQGRDPGSLDFVSAIAVVTDDTERGAAAKLAEYQSFFDVEGALAHYSASTGVDFSHQDLDGVISHHDTDSNRSLLSMFAAADRDWTLRDALAPATGFGRSHTIVGTPGTVTDELEAWLAATDTQGVNLIGVVNPESYRDFAELVVPELDRRGRIRPRPTTPTTLRHRLKGRDHVADDHPAAIHRRARLARRQEAVTR
ncbi:LLM class flavin-dependent oxidoreductase [Mycobacterium hodleri]|uniref:LLM class flavin-dependent oxidoreductase n=1 Tax=Mycolicibacterium hodleri TaxID=49897 RepID=A0A544VZQ1_9MYCO|nr:LLM class flavin-dependent oxidoreductase [Mycolicibacterium hodleri]TQR85471.1 LLM class flavin-dependent oxidoreductase [Mycolicibacterium hodleri]